ncbi:Rz-like spanin [Teseptimavirus T7]|uniref:Spanin, inner membrane subunit n=2 Tax=Escherichia phage T7 TaxID=10760 RepID=SPAN1_BPT7|nr:Rz-like spanin [Escherichia phage T7]P03803.1 RecName: Full=Spanin, inner membrane subunit; Short=i-spanin; AltName: Full=Gene product 18.5; Short=Gp18.5 [Escherichia phage T7]AXQ60566.1 Rz-like lysis protein [Synthetic phage]AAP33960.1 gene 18.5 [Escherichia phage T7]ACY75875.1 endopeptidase [Escherichia phage T7]AVH85569.1 Rz-like lysis protein [Escherichia phage T7]AXQ60613.1 Rz-like lysis protein [Synthetic phage]
MLEFLRKLIPWVLAGMLFGLGWHLGSDSMDAKWKQEVHNEYVKRVEAAKSTQRAIDAVSAKYQEDLAALEGSTDRIISDLRSDNKRLRVRVKTTGTSDGQCGFEPDGRAELDDRDAKRILAVTQKGDAWIRALQDTIRELQRK